MQSIKSYFSPLSEDLYADKNRWETTQIGRQIETYTANFFPDLKSVEIALFNIPEYEGSSNSASETDCKIRPLFYSFHLENIPRIVDLGTLQLIAGRKESFQIIQLVCAELLYNGIIPVVIGGGHDVSYAIYKAYVSLDKFISLTVVDSKFDIQILFLLV